MLALRLQLEPRLLLLLLLLQLLQLSLLFVLLLLPLLRLLLHLGLLPTREAGTLEPAE